MNRRLVPPQPLVGIHERRKHRTHPPGMSELPGDEVLGCFREAVRIARIAERVGTVRLVTQSLMYVHAAPTDSTHRFGHERGVEAFLLRQDL